MLLKYCSDMPVSRGVKVIFGGGVRPRKENTNCRWEGPGVGRGRSLPICPSGLCILKSAFDPITWDKINSCICISLSPTQGWKELRTRTEQSHLFSHSFILRVDLRTWGPWGKDGHWKCLDPYIIIHGFLHLPPRNSSSGKEFEILLDVIIKLPFNKSSS